MDLLGSLQVIQGSWPQWYTSVPPIKAVEWAAHSNSLRSHGDDVISPPPYDRQEVALFGKVNRSSYENRRVASKLFAVILPFKTFCSRTLV